MSNPVVHFEILGPDGPALSTFYSELFRWDLHDGRLPGWPHYALLRAGPTGIGGAIGTADVAAQPTIVLYVDVDDPQAYLVRAKRLGAQVVMPVTHIAEAEVTLAWLQTHKATSSGWSGTMRRAHRGSSHGLRCCSPRTRRRMHDDRRGFVRTGWWKASSS